MVDTWDPINPSRPSTMEFKGSEEFIRLQFEEYLLALLSSISSSDHLASQTHFSVSANQPDPTSISRPPSPPPDPTGDYSSAFISHWRTTSSYAIWSRHTSGQPLFSVVTPAHPCAGGLTIEDIQRRVTAQIVELKLDERVKEGREVLNKHLSAGRERVGAVLGNVWAEMESMRESQRKRAAAVGNSDDDGRSPSPALRPVEGDLTGREQAGGAAVEGASGWAGRKPNIDLAQVQANAAIAREKVGATLSGWWASAAEKKRVWEESRRRQQHQQHQYQHQASAGVSIGKGSMEARMGPVFGAGVGTGKKWTTSGWGWRENHTGEAGTVRTSSEENQLPTSSSTSGITGGLTAESGTSNNQEARKTPDTLIPSTSDLGSEPAERKEAEAKEVLTTSSTEKTPES